MNMKCVIIFESNVDKNSIFTMLCENHISKYFVIGEVLKRSKNAIEVEVCPRMNAINNPDYVVAEMHMVVNTYRVKRIIGKSKKLEIAVSN